MRFRVIVLGTSALLLIGIVFTQEYIPLVSVNSLRIEKVTDKEEYAVGETIHATLFYFNDRPHPVKFQVVTSYCVEGYHSNDTIRLTGMGDIFTAKAYSEIQANSNYTFARETFVSGYAGEYIIHNYGATRDQGFDVTKVVTIHEGS